MTAPATTIRRIRRGMHVETTGLGRTATWGRYTGRVERVRADQVFVQWDGSYISDQLNIEDVREIRPAYLRDCPCAQHDGKH